MDVISSYHAARTAELAAPRSSPRAPQPPAPAPTESVRPLVGPESCECEESKSGMPAADVSAGAVQMKYRRSEKTSLYIETQEGDIVRLKFRAREATDLQAAHASAAGASSSEIALQTRSSSRLSIRVRGDLSAEELAAIQEAVEQAGELAEDFFEGDLEAAFANAADLDIDGEQLARVSLKMRSVERMTYSGYGYAFRPSVPTPVAPPQVVGGEPVEPASGDLVTTPVGAPAVEPIAIAPERPMAVSEGPPAPVEGVAPAEADPAPVEGEDAAESSALDRVRARADAFRALGSFLSRLVERLSGDDGAPTTGPLDLSLKLRVFEATLATLAELRERAEPELPTLVHETVDALAGQESEPLDHVA